MTVNSKESVQIKPCVKLCKMVRREVRPVTCHEGAGEGLRCISTLFITPALNFVRIHNSKFHQNLSTQSRIVVAVMKPALLYCCEKQLKTTVNKKTDISIENYALTNALTTL